MLKSFLETGFAFRSGKWPFLVSVTIMLSMIVKAPIAIAEWDEGAIEKLPEPDDLPAAEGPSLEQVIEGSPQSQAETPTARPSWKKRAYHFGVGVARPDSIGGELNHYQKLFGQPRYYPTVWGEYYFLNLMGVDLGFRSTISYYSARGHAATNLDPDDFPLQVDLTDDQVDRSQNSTLSLIPVQGAGVLSFSPLRARWLIAQAWYGYQWVYVQNTMSDRDSADQSGATFLNSGWNQETVYGAALSFDLSWVDPRSTYSMRVFGISGIYMTPFYEVHRASKADLGAYDRETWGLMFTFETLR